MIPLRWLVVLIIADLVFLPMFHIQGVPFKFGYLVMLGFFVTNFPRRGFSLQMTMTLALLALITAVASIASSGSNGSAGLGSTFTIVATYLMAAVAFVFGSRSGKLILRYIPHLMIGYFVVNLVVIMFWEHLLGTPFGDFYWYVPDFLGTGTKLVRAGGLHQNPNVSARFMSVLLIGLFIGLRYGEIRFRSPLTLLALIVGLALPFVVSSRSEMLVSLIIVVSVVWTMARRGGVDKRLVAMMFVALVITTVIGRVGMPYFGETASTRIEVSISTLRNDPFNGINGLGRPIQAWSNEDMWSRVSGSPVFGNCGEGGWYHNDWATILVRSGIVGFGLFVLVVVGVARVHVIFLAPLFISAMTNTFVFSPQHFTIFMLLVGVTWRIKSSRSQPMTRPPDRTSEQYRIRQNKPNPVAQTAQKN